MAPTNERPFPHFTPLRIAAIYAVIGGLWILFSDSVLAMLVADPEMITRLSIYKGWLYVLATALLLHWMIRQYVSGRRETLLTLGESERYNRALFELSPIGLAVCLVDLEQFQGIVQVAELGCDVVQYATAEIVELGRIAQHEQPLVVELAQREFRLPV